MDQIEHGECQQNALDSKCEKSNVLLFPSPQKPEIVENKNWETKFASQTPEKTNQPLNIKFEQREVELLQRHKTVVELFDGLNCSLRLLGLSKKSPIFQNIRTQVEVLTQRKFSFGHLAQMKYLLSEAIQIDKILVHDKKTLCVKPDMKITLLFNVIEGHHELSDFIALRKLFASRLINYFTAHPEDCDIPEAMLPDPFNQSKQTAFGGKVNGIPEVIVPESFSLISRTISPEQSLANASIEDLPITIESELLPKSSHMPPSFSRHFSDKVVTSPIPLSSAPSFNLQNQDAEFVKAREFPDLSSKSDSGTDLDTKHEQEKESPEKNSESIIVPPTHIQLSDPQFSINNNGFASPLWKHASAVDTLTVETPAQSTPKRVTPNTDDNHKGIGSQKQESSCKAAKRSLDFSLLEGNQPECYEFSPDNISQILHGSSALHQKVDEGLGCAAEEHKMSQADSLDQQISINLPSLVSLIHHIFQSVNYAPITKEELVHKITINSFDFDERRQVEEQIEILEKLVPDWMCMKLAPTGDVLYSIKKMSDLNSVLSTVAIINHV